MWVVSPVNAYVLKMAIGKKWFSHATGTLIFHCRRRRPLGASLLLSQCRSDNSLQPKLDRWQIVWLLCKQDVSQFFSFHLDDSALNVWNDHCGQMTNFLGELSAFWSMFYTELSQNFVTRRQLPPLVQVVRDDGMRQFKGHFELSLIALIRVSQVTLSFSSLYHLCTCHHHRCVLPLIDLTIGFRRICQLFLFLLCQWLLSLLFLNRKCFDERVGRTHFWLFYSRKESSQSLNFLSSPTSPWFLRSSYLFRWLFLSRLLGMEPTMLYLSIFPVTSRWVEYIEYREFTLKCFLLLVDFCRFSLWYLGKRHNHYSITCMRALCLYV